MEQKEPPSGEMLRDTLDMLVLKTLQKGPMHGYGIAEFIEERSAEVLRVEEGALYPALHRLELRGLLASEWGVSDNRRRAKFYRLTAAGRKQLQKDSARWGLISAAIGRIMTA
jgi:transcriptional regulator